MIPLVYWKTALELIVGNKSGLLYYDEIMPNIMASGKEVRLDHSKIELWVMFKNQLFIKTLVLGYRENYEPERMLPYLYQSMFKAIVEYEIENSSSSAPKRKQRPGSDDNPDRS